MLRKAKKYFLLLILILFFSTSYSQTKQVFRSAALKCDSIIYQLIYGDYANPSFYFGSGYNRKSHYRVFNEINNAPKRITKKLLIISDTLKHKFKTKFISLQFLSFIITSNEKSDSNVKYMLVMAYPIVDEISIIFNLPFDKKFNLLVDSKFINDLLSDGFITNLNPCKAIEKANENKIFNEYYKKFKRKVRDINLIFDFKNNIWIYEIRGITLDNEGEDGVDIPAGNECCKRKTIRINAMTYEVIEVKDENYSSYGLPI
jgi:hypothetical protein